MATAVILVNVVQLTVTPKNGSALVLTMSLQRHHYRFCAGGAALPMNSLFHASVGNAAVVTDATEVGNQMEKLIEKHGRPAALFGQVFTCTSQRTYMVDNSALDPKGWPNHFFVTGGPSVWDRIGQVEYAAAGAIRRLEEAIDARPASSRATLLDPKGLRAVQQQPGGGGNPVVPAAAAAKTALQIAGAGSHEKLAQVSGRADILHLIKNI